MEENSEELTIAQKTWQFIKAALKFILQGVLLVDVAILALVLLSFLFYGKFSAIAVSERVFWAGMVAIMMGGIAIAATAAAGHSFGVPIFIRKPEDAKKLLEKAPEIRAEQEKRYNAGARLWLIGMGCVAISALVEQLFS
jgi:hypothetical protein